LEDRDGYSHVITRDAMMEPILKVSPSFEPIWHAFLAEWKDHPEGLPQYLVLSDLARHIARLLESAADRELREIFQVVEAWHVHGDPYVKEAATVGLLEDLQNTNVVGDQAPDQCLAYLGPQSLRWWRKVERFWEKGELIRDD
jgi:hypothetical protein